MYPRAYAREPSFNHLKLTSLKSIFSRILAHNFHLSLLTGGQEIRTWGKARRYHQCAPLTNCPTPGTSCPPPPNTYPRTRQYSRRPTPFRVATRRWKNLFLALRKMHLPCFSFDIVTAGEGGGAY